MNSRASRGHGSAAIPRRPGRILYVVLLALAWIQVSYAAHQFEHVTGDFTDTCSVCSHFDRLDHAVPPAAISGEALPHAVPATALPAQPAFRQAFGHYFSRAPPLV